MADCNEVLKRASLAYPRTCRLCGFGPCNDRDMMDWRRMQTDEEGFMAHPYGRKPDHISWDDWSEAADLLRALAVRQDHLSVKMVAQKLHDYRMDKEWSNTWINKGKDGNGPDVEWGKYTMGTETDGVVPLKDGQAMSIIEVLNYLNWYEAELNKAKANENSRS